MSRPVRSVFRPLELTLVVIALISSAGLAARGFFPALLLASVAIAAWFGGAWAGLSLVAAMTSLSIALTPAAPAGQAPSLLPLLTFTVLGLLLTGLTSALKAGRARADSASLDLRRVKQKYALAARGARVGLWDWDFEAESFTGSSRVRPLIGPQGGWADGIPAALAARLHAEDRARVRKAFDDHLHKGLPFDVEFRLRAPTGRYRWFHAQGQAAWSPDGTPTRMAGTLGDVTERKRVEVRLRSLVEAMPQIVWTADETGEVDTFNGRWLEYTGLPRDDAPRDGWQRVVHPDDAAASQKAWGEAVALGGPLETEERLRRFDGSYRWHLVRAVPVRDRTGRVLKWFGTCTDIDDHKRSELTARVLADVGAALAGAPDAEEMVGDLARLAVPRLADWCTIDLIDGDGPPRRTVAHADPGRVAEWQEVERAVTGLGAARRGTAEVLRTGTPLLFPDLRGPDLDAVARDADHRRALERWGVCSALCVPLLARGRTLGALTLTAAESKRTFAPDDLAGAQEFARLVALAVDNARLFRQATEARRAAEDADRAKDRFLAMLSHELRTPLTPALLAVSALLDDPETPGHVRPAIESARRGIELEARLVDDLLDVTRVASGKLQVTPERVEAQAVVTQALASCSDLVRDAGLNLELRLDAPGAMLDADPVRVQQVVWNLVKNATKFTPPGGTVTVHTRCVKPEAVSGDGEPAGELEIEVSDTGVGIEPELLGRIFDAFDQGGEERSRRSGGLGLGLAISRAIAEAHGGTLRAWSAGRGFGSAFTLVLPAADGADPECEPLGTSHSPAPATPGRWPDRILLVEDDEPTRRVLARLLRQRGSEVTAADSLAEAARVARGRSFDLVISDIGLPDGSGLEIPRLLGLGADSPAIALTGYGSENDLRRCRESGFSAHVIKPVDFGHLERVVLRATSANGRNAGEPSPEEPTPRRSPHDSSR